MVSLILSPSQSVLKTYVIRFFYTPPPKKNLTININFNDNIPQYSKIQGINFQLETKWIFKGGSMVENKIICNMSCFDDLRR